MPIEFTLVLLACTTSFVLGAKIGHRLAREVAMWDAADLVVREGEDALLKYAMQGEYPDKPSKETTMSDKPASEKQVRYLNDLLRQCGRKPLSLNITSAEASNLIRHLMPEARARRAEAAAWGLSGHPINDIMGSDPEGW